MKEWFANLYWYEHIYLWVGVAATLCLIIQIIMMCFSSFGDADIDGDGDIDVDTDSGISIFTVKSVTAFFAVGSWAGLLTCALIADSLDWVSVIVATFSGVIASALVVVGMALIVKLQSNGLLQPDKFVGLQATVYVNVPASRGGTGKITLEAQGKFIELDAITDSEQALTYGEKEKITAMQEDCATIERITDGESPEAQ